ETRNLHAVIGWAGGMAFEEAFGELFDAAADDQNEEGEAAGDGEHHPVAEAADQTKHGTDPNRRSRGQTPDLAARFVQDHPGAQKTDASEKTLNNAADRICIDGQSAVGR